MTTTYVYEVINPSDKMTLLAPSTKVAGLAVMIVSPGYGAQRVDDANESAGPFLFGGGKTWMRSQGLNPDGDTLLAIMNGDVDLLFEVASALASWALGDQHARADFDAAMRAIDDPAKRDAFVKERNDRRRSSLNDGETYAHRVALGMRGALVGLYTKELNTVQLEFELAAREHEGAAFESRHELADKTAKQKVDAIARLSVLRERLRELRRLGLPEGVS